MRRQGFTLTEVALSLGLGLIMAGAGVAGLRYYGQQSSYYQAKAILQGVRARLQGYYAVHGRYPSWQAMYFNCDPHTRQPFVPGGGSCPRAFLPRDPILSNNFVYSTQWYTALPNGAGGYVYDPRTGDFRINVYDADYGPQGRVWKYDEYPSHW